MTIGTVDVAIQRLRAMAAEFEGVDLTHWRSDHTRYAFVDPMLQSLGWDPDDPEECHPEYPRSYQNRRRVDYTLFGTPDVRAVGNNVVPPDIVIESKPLRAVPFACRVWLYPSGDYTVNPNTLRGRAIDQLALRSPDGNETPYLEYRHICSHGWDIGNRCGAFAQGW